MKYHYNLTIGVASALQSTQYQKQLSFHQCLVNPVPNLTATYSYDDLSRLVSAANEAGTVSFTYDTRGRIKTSTDVFGHLVEFGYDGASNRTQLKLDGSVHTTYAYDAANRLTTLTDEASQNFGYDVADRFDLKTGAERHFGFLPRARPLSLL